MNMNRKPYWMSLTAAGALALGLAACTEPQQERAEADAEYAGEAVEMRAGGTGAELREEAVQVGEAIEAGAREAAQEVDQATDRLAQEAREQRAETRADDRSAH